MTTIETPRPGTKWRNPATCAEATVLDYEAGGMFSVSVMHYGAFGAEGEWVRVSDFVSQYTERVPA